MSHAPRRDDLEKLLDLCARSERVSELAARRTHPARATRLRERSREIVEELRGRVADAEALPEVLGELRARNALDEHEMILLLMLLHRRIQGEHEPVPARELLRLFGGDTSELLQRSALLNDGSRLLKGGLVLREGAGAAPGLDGEYLVSEEVYLDVYHWYHRLGEPPRPEDHSGPYVADLEHFLDLRRLVQLHQRRASALFPWSYWGEMYPEVAESPATLTGAIRRLRRHIALREAATTGTGLALVRLREEIGLTEDEEVTVMTLLFHELDTAPPLLEYPELPRLLAVDEGDLLRQRARFAPGTPLRENGVIVLVSEYDEPDFIAEVFLAAWVADRLLTDIGEAPTIDPDEQRRFHDYLERLDGSDDFYRNL